MSFGSKHGEQPKGKSLRRAGTRMSIVCGNAFASLACRRTPCALASSTAELLATPEPSQP